MSAEAAVGAAAAPAGLWQRVESRLRPVCPGWPPDQFATLVADVVRFHARWDRRDTPAPLA